MSRLVLSMIVTCVFGQAALTAQAPNVSKWESTVTATVDRIDRSSRVLRLRADGNTYQEVYVDPKVALFNELKVGDVITVKYTESLVVQVRPDAKPGGVRDTTEEAKKSTGDQVLEQKTAVVTIVDVNVQDQLVSYRTGDGLRAVKHVNDKQLLKGLRAGDRVEVTLTRERAIDIQRKR